MRSACPARLLVNGTPLIADEAPHIVAVLAQAFEQIGSFALLGPASGARPRIVRPT
jgi:hypothetical protein